MKMLKIKNSIIYAFAISLLFIASGCSDSGTGPEPGTDFDASAMLNNEGNNIIVQTYINLNAEAGKLVDAVTKLKNNTTQANLEAAQQQWRNTRVNWEASEAFLYGPSPVEKEGVDPKIDDWPLDKTALNGVLSSDFEIDADYVAGLETSLKGFHTVEFLLFGANNDKVATDYTDRELDYLVASTERLKFNTNILETSYSPNDGNWIKNITTPGSDSRYTTQKDVLEQLVTGMAGIANEVATSKIGGPYSEKDDQKVESQFSFNSKTDFQNNIRSIQNIYTGDYDGHQGEGLTDFIVTKDPDLDARFKSEINDAIEQVGNIEGNFRTAITQNRESVKTAQEAVRTVLSTLQGDISQIINDL